jgi:hypothetical protein
MSRIEEASIESKKEFTLPEGATVIKKNSTIRVREIENGFIIIKSYDIQWTPAGDSETKYDYFSKEWYQKDNPLKINMPKEVSLVDKLD